MTPGDPPVLVRHPRYHLSTSRDCMDVTSTLIWRDRRAAGQAAARTWAGTPCRSRCGGGPEDGVPPRPPELPHACNQCADRAGDGQDCEPADHPRGQRQHDRDDPPEERDHGRGVALGLRPTPPSREPALFGGTGLSRPDEGVDGPDRREYHHHPRPHQDEDSSAFLGEPDEYQWRDDGP
jgi:hypothetical protein